jgi:hypothetical protein
MNPDNLGQNGNSSVLELKFHLFLDLFILGCDDELGITCCRIHQRCKSKVHNNKMITFQMVI